MQNSDKIKISIGLPVYNGEKFLKEKINSILKLNINDFELLISDNASTDNTHKICEEFVEKDKRVKYFCQEKNFNVNYNFNFVLEKARGEYFFWTAVDDIILPGFIEKNIVVLESNNKIVCSTSQVKPYGEKTNYLSKNDVGDFTEKFKKTIIQKFTPLRNYSTYGSYEEKIRYYLKLRGHQQVFFGIFRTNQLREFFVHDFITGFDWATMLNALKFGDFNILEEFLTYRYDGGASSKGVFSYARGFNLNALETIFLYIPLTLWCFRHLGAKLFLRNLDCFLKLNLEGAFYLFVDIMRWSKKTMLGK
jgi:glycosyltransferase involved in cell wall biosynthesis